MHIKAYSLGELQTNTYLLVNDHRCVLIDPADDANFILEELSRNNLVLEGMIATHGHFDHVMAAGEIELATGVPLSIHEKDAFLINRMKETARHFLGHDPIIIPPKNITSLTGRQIMLGGISMKILHTPGHTPGGISIYLKNDECMFTGDTLFRNAVGRTDLSYSSQADLKKSISALYSFPEETIIYPGHGDATSIGAEKSHSVSFGMS